jgi:hypothetical protein
MSTINVGAEILKLLRGEIKSYASSHPLDNLRGTINLSDTELGCHYALRCPVYKALLKLRNALEDMARGGEQSTPESSLKKFLAALTAKEKKLLFAIVMEFPTVPSVTKLGISPTQFKESKSRLVSSLLDTMRQEENLDAENSQLLTKYLSFGGLVFLCEAIPWSKWATMWIEHSRYISQPPKLAVVNEGARRILFDLVGVDERFVCRITQLSKYNNTALDHAGAHQKDGFLGIKLGTVAGSEHDYFIALAVDPKLIPSNTSVSPFIVTSSVCHDPLSRPEALWNFTNGFSEPVIHLRKVDEHQIPTNITRSNLSLEPGELLDLICGLQCNPEIAFEPRSVSQGSFRNNRFVSVLSRLVPSGIIAVPRALGDKIPAGPGQVASLCLSGGWWENLKRENNLSGSSILVAVQNGASVIPFARLDIKIRNGRLSLEHLGTGEYADTSSRSMRYKLKPRIDLTRLPSVNSKVLVIVCSINRRLCDRNGKPLPRSKQYCKAALYDHDLSLTLDAVPATATTCKVAILPWPSRKKMVFVAYIGEELSKSPFVEAFDMATPSGTLKRQERHKLTDQEWRDIRAEIQGSRYASWLEQLG